MTSVSRRAWATIDLNALRKNLSRVRSLAPASKIYPVIKSNAYGHGMEQAAAALRDSHTNIAGFGVATLDEALALRKLYGDQAILLLNGFINKEELQECVAAKLEPVIHSEHQVELVQQLYSQEILSEKRKLWIKYNTGMNRLGMSREQSQAAYLNLHSLPGTELILMSHLACADDPNNAESSAFTEKQLADLSSLRGELVSSSQGEVVCSMAASAGILHWPQSHMDTVRPGVMLYGGSPMVDETSDDLGLQAVMKLSSRIIAIRDLKAGDSIGYGATYVCDRDTRVGTVSIGYGDGYPRCAENGTPVIVKSASGLTRTRLIGRVSMDMITVDLTGIDDVQLHDEIILWGPELCADEVAKSTSTISYELFCKVTSRVEFDYVG